MNKATCCLIYQTNHLDELKFDEQTKVMHTIPSYNLSSPSTLLFLPNSNSLRLKISCDNIMKVL